MVGVSRTQLQMMLLKQAGPGLLSLSNPTLAEAKEFLQKIEQLTLDEKLTPVIVYWSSRDANRLLPSEQKYRELMREAFHLSLFSEDLQDATDEWCFLVMSQLLCTIVYAQETDEPGRFQCVGTVDPDLVRQAFDRMLPIWQQKDFAESNAVQDALTNLGTCTTTPDNAQICRNEWPVIKTAPAADGQILKPSGPVDPVTGAVNPAFVRPTAPKSKVVIPIIKSDMPVANKPVELSDLGTSEVHEPDQSVLANLMKPEDEQPLPPSPSMADVVSAEPEGPSLVPLAAQEIIKDIIGKLRQSSDLTEILQAAIEKLVHVGLADRGLIWQIVGDELAVTNEYAQNENTPFVGTHLNPQESSAIASEFISRFPDETGFGVISITDIRTDTKLHKLSQTLWSLLELGEVRARLVAQLRSQSVVLGFLELQQCGKPRYWSQEDATIMQSVAEMLSVVVKEASDQSKIAADAQEKRLINEIATLFRASGGQKEKEKDTLAQSVKLVADHMGFVNAQLYLYNPEEGLLEPQMLDVKHSPVNLAVKDNPFVIVYESGRPKIINAEVNPKPDPYFGHDSALVIPLLAEGEIIGVLGLWTRLPNPRQLAEQDAALALTIATQLVSFIRADNAIAQIRADRARESLINRVATETRQNWKDVDKILETLVAALQEYFSLSLSAVSLVDGQSQDYTKSKFAGELAPPEGSVSAETAPNVGELLMMGLIDRLKKDEIVFLGAKEIEELLAAKGALIPERVKSATVVPLVHGGSLKAALCMLSSFRQVPYSDKDMKMVGDLAYMVAGAITHKELVEQVELQAITDPMTGLFNRRHFQEQFSKEMDRFGRQPTPFSYIIIDLDYLKKINDTLGHQFGDAAIKHIANVLKRNVRDVDTAARYGGEEFVILLPATDTYAARIAAERLCAAIRAKEVEGVGIVTASVGVATFPDDAQDRDQLTELADQALYLAKHRGRNRVCSVSDDLMPSLKERGEEALEIQKEAIKHKAQEMASIDLNLIAEHGILGILGAIIKIIEARDAYTNERSPRAAEFAGKMAQALHLSKDQTTVISLAAILHNVGKIALPEEILQKQGPLTDEERKIVQQSPVIGAKILEPAKHLHRVASVIESYHENWDGTGYPNGVARESIPLESRVISLVDAYVAMTSDRPWRKAMSHEEAVKAIEEGAGKKWDPRLVKLFLSMVNKEAKSTKATQKSDSG
ncbi:MAG: diguanylate cyclase [Candidatus Obscuribacterales bacterium]|nr:diguanylate cyclase [Candidatus Obscuribacterales bacterium]